MDHPARRHGGARRDQRDAERDSLLTHADYQSLGAPRMKSGTDMINDSKARIRQVDANEAKAIQERGNAVFLDVRDLQEVNLGRIPGAVHISRGNLETKIEAVVARDTEVVIYCASGNR